MKGPALCLTPQLLPVPGQQAPALPSPSSGSRSFQLRGLSFLSCDVETGPPSLQGGVSIKKGAELGVGVCKSSDPSPLLTFFSTAQELEAKKVTPLSGDSFKHLSLAHLDFWDVVPGVVFTPATGIRNRTE